MSNTTVKAPNRWLLRLSARRSLAERLRQNRIERELRRRKRHHRRGRPTPKTKTAVYLVGCQRSGTDMSIYLLDRSLDVDTFNENHRGAFSKCRIKETAVIRRLIEKSRAPCIVFKPVCDSHRVDEMLSWHKPSRAVWLYRDYRAVANSTVVMWGDANLRHLRQLVTGGGDWGWSQWNREGYPDEALAEVRGLIDEHLTPHGAAALYWYLRNRCYFAQRLTERDDVTVFRYRDLVTDPTNEFARLCRILNLEFSPEIAQTVHARSLTKGANITFDSRIEARCEDMLARLDAEAERCKADEPS